MKKAIICLLISFLVVSCVPTKKIVYLQGNQESASGSVNYEPIIQNDDLLYIYVSSLEPSASAPFNLEGASSNLNNQTFSAQKQTYLVDSQGAIDFPVIGKIKTSGLTIAALKEEIKQKVKVFVINPVINIRLVNFKVTVIGEVNKPGVINIESQRLTLLEALAMAGDLTLYGKRENILLVRDIQGIKTYNKLDITQADFVNSPFYYLDQNDLVYVEPRKSKIDSTALSSNIMPIVSIASLLITTLILLKK